MVLSALAPFTGAFAIDGSNSVRTTSATTINTVLTTTNSNDLIIVILGEGGDEGGTSSISDTAGLSWNTRNTLNNILGNSQWFYYWAVAPTALTNDKITTTYSLGSGNLNLFVFGVSGVNASSPFECSCFVANYITSGTTVFAHYTPTRANDMVITWAYAGDNPTFTIPGGFTEIGAQTGGPSTEAAYNTLTPTSSMNVIWTFGTAEASGMFVDALHVPIPVLYLANSVYGGNVIAVVEGSASDNAAVTAVCGSGDTCQIWKVGGTSSLASGTTTATLSYNALSGGYTQLYGNDITENSISTSNVFVNRVVATHNTVVTFTNSQAVNAVANVPISFTLNAMNFTSWESKTLNNTFVYFNNGTIARSLIEGNVSNEIQPMNTLSNSNSVLYWLEFPPANTFLGKSGATATVQLGFGTVGTSVFDSNFIGIAPQLTCANPSLTVTCSSGGPASGKYGQFDTSNRIFTIADDFPAGSLNTVLWSKAGGQTTNQNGMYIRNFTTTAAAIETSQGFTGGPYILEGMFFNLTGLIHGAGYLQETTATSLGTCSGTLCVFNSNSIPLYTSGYAVGIEPNEGGADVYAIGTHFVNGGGGNTATYTGYPTSAGSVTTSSGGTPIISVEWVKTGVENFTYNYTYSASSTNSLSTYGTTYFAVAAASASGSANVYIQWVRARLAPPNSIMPSISFNPQSYSLPAPALSSCVANSVVDVGQYESCTETTTGGDSPYTVKWSVVNSVTTSTVTNTATYSGIGASNTFTWKVNGWETTNSPEEVNVVVTDSASGAGNSVYSSTFTVNNALSFTSLSLSKPVCDTGQSEVATAAWSGGAANYNVLYYNSTSKVLLNVYNGVTIASNTYTFTCSSPTQANSIGFNSVVFDSATTNAVVNSVITSVIVSPALGVPTITGFSSNYDKDQPATFTASTSSTGNQPYTYNWLIYNGINLVGNFLYNNVGSNTNTIAPSLSTLGANYYTINVIVTDGATSPETQNSAKYSFTVNSALAAPPAPTLALSTVDNGQVEDMYTQAATTGTGPWTYNFIIAYSGNDMILAISSSSSNAFAYTTTITGTFVANVFVTDAANTPETTNSVYSSSFTVNSVLAVPSAPALSASLVDNGQVENMYVPAATTGTGPWTYNFVVSNSVNGQIIASSSSASNSFSYTTATTGALAANVFITDSGTPAVTVNSVYSLVFTVNSALAAPPAPTLSSSTLDKGQVEDMYTPASTTGTGPWTYNFLVSYSGNSMLLASSSGSSNSFAYTTSAAGTFATNVFVTDSANTAETANSVYSSAFTVNNALKSPVISVSNVVLDAGQYLNVTAYETGGSASYTYNFIISNSVTNTVLYSQPYTTSQSKNSLLWEAQSAYLGNSISANVIVTDATGASANSASTYNIVLNPVLSTGWTASNSVIDPGQYQTLTANANGGANIIEYPIFNTGSSVSIDTGTNSLPTGASSRSMFAWIYYTGSNSNNYFVYSYGTWGTADEVIGIEIDGGDLYISGYDDDYDTNYAIPTNTWIMVGLTYSGGTAIKAYLNGNVFSGSIGSALNTVLSSPHSSVIGATPSPNVHDYFTGNIINLQVYNTALSASSVNALYLEGPLGSPLWSTGNVVVWLPLQDGTADFSNMSNGGAAYNVVYGSNGNAFQFNSVVYNSVGSLKANSLSGFASSSSNAFSFQVASSFGAGAATANVAVADLSGANAGNTLGFTVENTLTASIASGTTLPANIDLGQGITFSGTGSGGDSPYTYNFMVASSPTNTLVAASGVQASNSYTYTTTSTGNFYANVVVVDSATTNGVANSVYSGVFTVNTALAVPAAPALSASLVDNGQTEKMYVPASTTGTGPWTYNFVIAYSGNDMILASSSSSSNAFSYTTAQTGSFYANVLVTDSAASPVTQNSAYSSSFTVNSALAVAGILPSNPTYNVGQTVTFTETLSGKGTSPYTYNWIIANGITGSQVYNVLYKSVASTSNVISFSAGTLGVGTYNALVIVTDGANTAETSTTANNLFVVSSAFSAGYPTPSNPIIDNGQSITLMANPAGGTSPYSYQWYYALGGACGSSSSILTGETSDTLTYSPTVNTIFCYTATDSEAPANTQTSGNSIVTVNATLEAGNPSPAGPTVDSGRGITLTANPSGGTVPYSYQWYYSTGSGCSSADSAVASGTGLSVTNVITANTEFCYTITDSAYSPATASSGNVLVAVNSVLGAGNPTPAVGAIDNGQSITLTANPSGGTPAYTYQWYYVHSGACSSANSVVASGTSATVTNAPESNTIYCYTVSDSSSNAPTVTSGNNFVMVYPALSVAAPSPSTQTVTQGGTAAITDGGASGGNAPYTYQWAAAIGSAPTLTSTTAALANTLLGTGTSSGEAQSQNAVFATTTGTTAGPYWFVLYANDSNKNNAGSSASEVVVNQQSSGGGGGGGPSQTSVQLTDNLNATGGETVFNTYLVDTSDHVVSSASYAQDDVPIIIKFPSSELLVFNFACSVNADGSLHAYTGTVYGLGLVQCNSNYTVSNGDYNVIYSTGPQATTSTTTTSKTTSVSTTTVPTTTVPTTTVPAVNMTQQAVVNSTMKSANVNFSNGGVVLDIGVLGANQVNAFVTLINVTSNATAPANYSKVYVFYLNVSSSTNTITNVTVRYNCGLDPDSLAVFYLQNSTWVPIYNSVVLPGRCVIKFTAPNMHYVGVFLATPTTTTTIMQQQGYSAQTYEYAGAAAVAVIALALLYHFLRRKPQSKKG